MARAAAAGQTNRSRHRGRPLWQVYAQIFPTGLDLRLMMISFRHEVSLHLCAAHAQLEVTPVTLPVGE